MKAASDAAANRRFLKIERSSIGERTRLSISTKPGRNTAAAARLTITDVVSQPDRPPLEMPYTSPVSPIRNVIVPSASNDRSSDRPLTSCRIIHAHALPPSANGTLNQNTQCHEISTRAPPSTGPMTSPIAATIVLVPIAMPSCSRGNASVTIAAELANRNEPAMPWRIRHRISWVPLSAKPAPNDATANNTKPPIYAFLRPNWSDSRPALSTSTVEAIMYTRMTHTSSSRPVCRLRSRSGSAMISVPELIVASSIPRLVQDSAHHLYESCPAWTPNLRARVDVAVAADMVLRNLILTLTSE